MKGGRSRASVLHFALPAIVQHTCHRSTDIQTHIKMLSAARARLLAASLQSLATPPCRLPADCARSALAVFVVIHVVCAQLLTYAEPCLFPIAGLQPWTHAAPALPRSPAGLQRQDRLKHASACSRQELHYQEKDVTEAELRERKSRAVRAWMVGQPCRSSCASICTCARRCIRHAHDTGMPSSKITLLCSLQEANVGPDKMRLAKILKDHQCLVRGSAEQGQKLMDALLEWKAETVTSEPP